MEDIYKVWLRKKVSASAYVKANSLEEAKAKAKNKDWFGMSEDCEKCELTDCTVWRVTKDNK